MTREQTENAAYRRRRKQDDDLLVLLNTETAKGENDRSVSQLRTDLGFYLGSSVLSFVAALKPARLCSA